MPDDDYTREPEGTDDEDLDWSADVEPRPASPLAVHVSSPVAVEGGEPGQEPAEADVPDSERPTESFPPDERPETTAADDAAKRPSGAPSAAGGSTGAEIPATQPTMRAVKTPGPPGMQVAVAGRTDVGLVREHNEDNFLVADLTRAEKGWRGVREIDVGTAGILLAVCDGMGGAAAGEVASQMAVDTIYEWLHAGGVPKDHDALARRLVTAVEEAGRRIFGSAKADRTRRGMGTTATAAALVDSVLFLAQVGDSRAYVVRRGEIGLVTRDQSLVNQLIEAGQLTEAEAESFEHSNIILQALGTSPEVQVDLTHVPLRRGDRLLLCSDGLSGLVPAEILREVLDQVSDPAEACDRLVDMANAGGGHDNITVVVAHFDGDELAPPGEDEPAVFARYDLPPDPEDVLAEETPPAGATAEETRAGEAATAPAGAAAASDPSPVDTVVAARARRPAAGSGRWAIALVVLVAAGLATYLVVSDDSSSIAGNPDEATPASAIPVPRTKTGPAPMPPDVRQRCVFVSLPLADLVVDGRTMARLDENGKATLHLDAGFHDVEVRDGSTRVAGSRVDVRMDRENQFELLPPGLEEPSGDAEMAKPPDAGRTLEEIAREERAAERRRERREREELGSEEAPGPPDEQAPDEERAEPPSPPEEREERRDSPIAPNPFY